MKPTTTATITRGVKTNRVRVRRTITVGTAKAALVRYRKDESVRGLPYVATCFSIPVEELNEMDELAERVQMSRSALIRAAVKHFKAKVLP